LAKAQVISVRRFFGAALTKLAAAIIIKIIVVRIVQSDHTRPGAFLDLVLSP
jgi:hypothetical protein